MTTEDERIVYARARCSTCSAHWSGVDALERAERHAALEHHRVEGLSQTTLSVDRRPS